MKTNNLCVAAPVFVILSALIALSRRLVEVYEGDGTLLRGLVSLRVSRNPGAAFGLFSGTPVIALILGTAALLALTGYILFGRLSAFQAGCLASTLAGGAANLYERFMLGAVTDWISLDFISFPSFNTADICVSLGMVLFAVSLVFGKKGA
ncbi:MAG: signal peptidase II [Clostridiales bacterium]|nr:signal peptidase II [Clostridiales bacterium]